MYSMFNWQKIKCRPMKKIHIEKNIPLSSQVTFIYKELLTAWIVSIQLHSRNRQYRNRLFRLYNSIRIKLLSS